MGDCRDQGPAFRRFCKLVMADPAAFGPMHALRPALACSLILLLLLGAPASASTVVATRTFPYLAPDGLAQYGQYGGTCVYLPNTSSQSLVGGCGAWGWGTLGNGTYELTIAVTDNVAASVDFGYELRCGSTVGPWTHGAGAVTVPLDPSCHSLFFWVGTGGTVGTIRFTVAQA